MWTIMVIRLNQQIFFLNVTATTEIYPSRHPLSLRDALPSSSRRLPPAARSSPRRRRRSALRITSCRMSASPRRKGTDMEKRHISAVQDGEKRVEYMRPRRWGDWLLLLVVLCWGFVMG